MHYTQQNAVCLHLSAAIWTMEYRNPKFHLSYSHYGIRNYICDSSTEMPTDYQQYPYLNNPKSILKFTKYLSYLHEHMLPIILFPFFGNSVRVSCWVFKKRDLHHLLQTTVCHLLGAWPPSRRWGEQLIQLRWQDCQSSLPPLHPAPPCPWKNCLPQNQFLMPKAMGSNVLKYDFWPQNILFQPRMRDRE